jgi:acetaldehyde dehydrogenase (acetylating)
MLHDSDLVSLQEVRNKVEQAWAAFQKYRLFDQKQVDAIVEAMAAAGRANARRLAEMAVEETGYGNVKDKIAKNLLNADLLCRAMRGIKTVGLLRELPEQKVVEYGVPVGVVAALLPTTNPTSTVIYKTLISLKAGNGIVISPHPRAARCTAFTASLLHQAAIQAGAPEGLVQCLEQPTVESTQALMKHKRVSMILATGGHAMVLAAYSSGKPAFGVGPGNVPVYLEKTADVAESVARVVEGKAFDYGTVCSSEQALVSEAPLRDAVLSELRKQRAFLCNDSHKQALAKLLLKQNFRINPDCVGQSPQRIAQMAGFEVPSDTRILVVELNGVGKEHPLSVEKLSPVLAVYFVADHAAALAACEALARFGGLGHTSVIYTKNDARAREYAQRIPTMRVLVNTPAPAGSTGMTTNLFPSMTLGCGAMAGNITSDNVGPQHLINIKRLAWGVRKPEEALQIPPEIAQASSPAPAPAATAPLKIDRQAIAGAVEKFLAQRGIAVSGARNVAADVVDRFLASQRIAAPAAAPSCPLPERPAPPPPAAAPAAPEIVISDFVCENDVRDAIQRSKKIYIGPRTIVTPAARDLAGQHDILVVAQR